MKFKLTKSQVRNIEQLHAQHEENSDALASDIEVYNAAIATAFKVFEASADAYREGRDALEEAAKEIAAGLREAFDSGSDRWRASAAGDAAERFVQEWEEYAGNIADTTLNVQEPEQVDFDTSVFEMPVASADEL